MLGVTIETIKMTENSVYVNWFNEEKYAQYYKLILISTFSNPTGNQPSVSQQTNYFFEVQE